MVEFHMSQLAKKHQYTHWTVEEMLSIPAEEISSPLQLCADPRVSVILMTRNHAPYLRQALESVLCQVTSFSFEVLLGEDHSTDHSITLCHDLQTAYPKTVRVITAAKQVGITANFLRLQVRARAPFVALLEGDDYWTSANKLERQIELLDNNPDWAWCGARTLNRIHPLPASESYGLSEVSRRFVVHTSTIMYRRKALNIYPRFPDMVGWISMVSIVLSQAGRCGFLDETVSYYRRHAGGLYTGANTLHRIELAQAFTDVMRSHLANRYDKELFDRELWICSWELQLDPQTFSLQLWIYRIKILFSLIAPRLCLRMPGHFLKLVSNVISQPLRVVYFWKRNKKSSV